MLIGEYPFEDQQDPKNFRKTIEKIMSVQYRIPDYVHISQDCKHLLSRIFTANPLRRISIRDIKNHPWFLKNLPRELTEVALAAYYKRDHNAPPFSMRGIEDIMKIVGEAKTRLPQSKSVSAEEEDKEEEEGEGEEEEEEEDEYDKLVKQVHASGELKIS